MVCDHRQLIYHASHGVACDLLFYGLWTDKESWLSACKPDLL